MNTHVEFLADESAKLGVSLTETQLAQFDYVSFAAVGLE